MIENISNKNIVSLYYVCMLPTLGLDENKEKVICLFNTFS